MIVISISTVKTRVLPTLVLCDTYRDVSQVLLYYHFVKEPSFKLSNLCHSEKWCKWDTLFPHYMSHPYMQKVYPELIWTSASKAFLFFCSEADLYHSLVQNWQDFKYSLLRRSLWLRPVNEKENKYISAAPLWGLHLQRTSWFKKRESRLYCFYLINQIELFTHVW